MIGTLYPLFTQVLVFHLTTIMVINIVTTVKMFQWMTVNSLNTFAHILTFEWLLGLMDGLSQSKMGLWDQV